jgi:hypothetical protein
MRTGIEDLAARSASRITRAMSGERVARSRKESVPSTRRRIRRTSSSSEFSRSAFLIDTWSRSAPTGFTTKSTAPARMAFTTASIDPIAVCTMAGTSTLASRIRPSTPNPSRPGIMRSRITRSTGSGPPRRDKAASPSGATIVP